MQRGCARKRWHIRIFNFATGGIVFRLILFSIISVFTAEFVYSQSWELAHQADTKINLRDVFFLTVNQGWVVGDSGTILTTSNGGANWLQQVSGTVNQLYGVTFVSSTQGWVVGNGGTILATNDGGLTWVQQAFGTSNRRHWVTIV